MRRVQFLTAAIVAAVTFFSLQAFVGNRYHGYGRWRGAPAFSGRGGYCRPDSMPAAGYDRESGRQRGGAPVQPLSPADPARPE